MRKRRFRAEDDRFDLLRMFAVVAGIMLFVLETARVPVDEYRLDGGAH